MEKEYFDILIFSQEDSKTRHLKMRKDTIKIGSSLLVFVLLSTLFLFCDYIQVKKKILFLNQVRQEVQVRRSQIQLLSARIGDLEEQLSKMKDFDRRIRIIANLERGQDTTPFIGTGGFSPSVVQRMSKEEKDGSFGLNSYSLP
jgi:cell division protein FtsL